MPSGKGPPDLRRSKRRQDDYRREGKLDMKLFKGLLLVSAVGLAGVAFVPSARAADLPARQAAPIEYVRICDAYGAGFFYIPGTDTCLRVGGLALAELRGFDPSFSIVGPLFYGNGISHLGAGFVPSPSEYSSALDARTQSPWGTLRSFIRVDSFYGSNGSAALGSLGQHLDTFNTTAGTSASRLTTALNKAFLQFAGLTAGQAQSMFDFYADAYNYHSLRGSNSTVALLAYTATFGSGFSSTLSVEDQADRRAAIGSTIASTTAAPITVGGISATSFQAQPGGSRVSEIVGTIRLDQPWGAAQLSAAAHQVDSSLFGASALTTPPTASAFPALTSNSFGFVLSPGDKLWLQAAYEKGAFSYIPGNNLAYSYGSVNQNRFPGSGGTPPDYGDGGNPQINSDCVFTGSGACEQQSGWDITGAYKHYWLPILSSAIFGSYMEMHYPTNALNGFGGAAGVSNLKEGRVGFDIGAEFMYVHLNQTRPVGLAPNSALTAAGLPAFQSNNNQYESRLRIQRAF
jgi:Porin subfamily